MSDLRRTGAAINLEEIFRSQEFERRPVRWDGAPVPTGEAADRGATVISLGRSVTGA